jgi:telomerase reverse transcriptase
MDHATPTANVSALCRAVFSNLIADEFGGVGDSQKHNRDVFMTTIDQFVRLRRFESLTLHEAIQKMRVSFVV